MSEDVDTWFAREILPHEGALLRYLNRRWRQRDEVLDLRQEAYVRVYEAACTARPHYPKSFLFTTARNLMADRVRRNRIVSIEARADVDSLNVLVDELSPETRASAHEQLRALASAFDQLPPKCREVVWLRRVEELSQKAVAERLGLSERTVENHVARGVRRLADALFGMNRDNGAQEPIKDKQDESDHEQQSAD